MKVGLGKLILIEDYRIRAKTRRGAVVHLIACTCEVFRHIEMILREPVKIAQSQHPRKETGQVLHSCAVASSSRRVELCQEWHVVGMRELDKLSQYGTGRCAIPASKPA